MSKRAEQRIWQLLVALTGAAVFGAGSHAHHGPDEMINMLTQRIETGGVTPVLLYKRAGEWRILGELAKAADDLQHSIKLNPKFVGAIELLSEVFLMKGELAKARATAKRGIAVSESLRERAACQMVIARAYREEGNLEEALRACDAAFESYPRGNIDWYLIRGGLQRRLGLHDARIEGFQKGHEVTRSTVLRNAAIDAMIDAGRADEVMPLIGRQVEACRIKSSWLLRRGRAKLALGDELGARGDLESAISELGQRIHPIRPDVSLVVDRGLARALLGDSAGAREDLDHARELGATESMLAVLMEQLPQPATGRVSEKEPAVTVKREGS